MTRDEKKRGEETKRGTTNLGRTQLRAFQYRLTGTMDSDAPNKIHCEFQVARTRDSDSIHLVAAGGDLGAVSPFESMLPFGLPILYRIVAARQKEQPMANLRLRQQ